ncbi:hypothetical protein [Rufibacter roseus]|uniref:Lipoprotein n=1 Tax=Rufibacter roseus TaxID=1567108 RepID=A0ABW2DHR0_9BACT|nr:hypothetical protein [Rufibacter roseus]
MFFKKITIALLAVSIGGTLLSSCKVADMHQDAALAKTASEVPVVGRKALRPNKDFQLGAYAVTNIRRSWTRTSGFSFFQVEGSRKSQRYEFVLRDSAGLETYVTAEAGVSSQSIPLGKVFSIELGGENREVFVSSIQAGSSGAWQLITKDPGNDILFKDFSGVLQNGATQIRVEPVYQYQNSYRGSSTEILGYEFKSGVELLGAVQVSGRGKLWLKNELTSEQRKVLSAASASLLLYRKLNQQNGAEPQNPKVKLPISLF